MKRNNFWLISLVTAVITIASLHLLFPASGFASRFGYNHWKQHGRYCDGYNQSNAERLRDSAE